MTDMTPEERDALIRTLEHGTPVERLAAERIKPAIIIISDEVKAIMDKVMNEATYPGPGGLKELT